MLRIVFFLAITFFVFVQWFNSDMHSYAGSKKILMVIASNDFRDEEFSVPFAALKKEGFDIVVASSKLGPAKGMLGMSVDTDILLSSAKHSDYDAVVFVGGSGAQVFWDDVIAHDLARSMNKENKIVAAICIAPVILANAGILEGKKATVWKSESNTLESKGVKYTGKPVEVDANIITADGPSSAQDFAQAIINKLKEQ
jgi:protease I